MQNVEHTTDSDQSTSDRTSAAWHIDRPAGMTHEAWESIKETVAEQIREVAGDVLRDDRPQAETESCSRAWCTMAGNVEHDEHHSGAIVDFTNTVTDEYDDQDGWWGWLTEPADDDGLPDGPVTLAMEGRPFGPGTEVIRVEIPMVHIAALRNVLEDRQGRVRLLQLLRLGAGLPEPEGVPCELQGCDVAAEGRTHRLHADGTVQHHQVTAGHATGTHGDDGRPLFDWRALNVARGDGAWTAGLEVDGELHVLDVDQAEEMADGLLKAVRRARQASPGDGAR